MKLKRIVMPFLILSLLLTACANAINVDEYKVENNLSEVNDRDFKFHLVSEEEVYKADEQISLYGEITYVGEEEEIEIVHSSSPVFFDISEAERQINIEYTVQDIGVTTTLKPNESFRVPYDKSNSFIDDDQSFYHEFMESNGFPVGYYTVNGMTDFSVFENGDNQSATRYNIEATIDFKVTK